MTYYERFLNTKNALENQVGWTKYVSDNLGKDFVKAIQYQLDFLNENMENLTLAKASEIIGD